MGCIFLPVGFSETEVVAERYGLWTDGCVDFKCNWTMLGVKNGI